MMISWKDFRLSPENKYSPTFVGDLDLIANTLVPSPPLAIEAIMGQHIDTSPQHRI